MKISLRARNTAPSPTLGLTAQIARMKADGVDVVGFGAGEPDFDTPEPIKEAAITALRRGVTKYTASGGTAARRAGQQDRVIPNPDDPRFPASFHVAERQGPPGR